jgi:hypothetical protein
MVRVGPAAPQALVDTEITSYLAPSTRAWSRAMAHPDDLRTEANRMYWESELSVADIAEQLQLSRRALYDAVEPLPSGSACPTCGTPLVFENRSARNAGQDVCPACEAAHDEAALAAAAPVNGIPDDRAFDSPRAVRVGSAALAGAALGAIATLMFVPRR